MILNLSNRNLTLIRKGTYYFELSNYPSIHDDEWNSIMAFINYEKAHGRITEIICEDAQVLSLVQEAAAQLDGTQYIAPNVVGDEFLYHATNSNAAKHIFTSKILLSAIKVYGKTGEELSSERYETGYHDPADFFDYIMFGWGDHLVGDYVVLSDDFPKEEDFESGNFDAGVRFYFKYVDLIKHPGHVFDGFHAIKIKNEIILSDYLFACIVPEQFKDILEPCIPEEFKTKVHYLPQRGLTLSDWNDKVFDFVRHI